MTVKVPTPTANQPQDLQQLIRQGMPDKDIEMLLMNQYADDFLVKNLMAEVKKLRNAQKTTQGLTLVLAGAFLMLLGFIFAFVGSNSDSMLDLFLYGFTTIGLVVAFAGLIKIFN